MKHTNYEISMEIAHNAKEVFDFFYHMPNQSLLHPMIQSVTEIASGLDPLGRPWSEFSIVDKVTMMGLISYKHQYTSQRVLVEGSRVCAFATKSFPNISMQVQFSFLPEGEGRTKVVETVSIDSPWWVSGYVTKTAKSAHQSVLQNLKNYFEKPSK